MNCYRCKAEISNSETCPFVFSEDQYQAVCWGCVRRDVGLSGGPPQPDHRTYTETVPDVATRHAQMVLATVVAQMGIFDGGWDDVRLKECRELATEILAWEPGKGKGRDGDGLDQEDDGMQDMTWWTHPCPDCRKTLHVMNTEEWVEILDKDGDKWPICVECDAKRRTKGGK